MSAAIANILLGLLGVIVGGTLGLVTLWAFPGLYRRSYRFHFRRMWRRSHDTRRGDGVAPDGR